MSRIDIDQIWVGTFRTTGAHVVFDTRIQSGHPKHSGYVVLFSLNARKLRAFERLKVRSLLATVSGPDKDEVVETYRDWAEAQSSHELRALAELAIQSVIPDLRESNRSPDQNTLGNKEAVQRTSLETLWRRPSPRPRRRRGGPPGNVLLGSQAALVLIGAVNPLLGAAAFVGGLLWARSLERNEQSEHDEAVKRWRAERIETYAEYLNSEVWQRKRQAVISRAAGTCEHPGCTAAIQEVHHKQYPKRLGDEPLNWLEGLCQAHHEQRHAAY